MRVSNSMRAALGVPLAADPTGSHIESKQSGSFKAFSARVLGAVIEMPPAC